MGFGGNFCDGRSFVSLVKIGSASSLGVLESWRLKRKAYSSEGILNLM